MQRYFSILLAIVYTLFSVGVGVSKHYCSGELVNVEVFSTVEQPSCCGENHSPVCCDNEVALLAHDGLQLLPDTPQFFTDAPAVWPAGPVAAFPVLSVGPIAAETEVAFAAYSPPPPISAFFPLYALHCSLRLHPSVA